MAEPTGMTLFACHLPAACNRVPALPLLNVLGVELDLTGDPAESPDITCWDRAYAIVNACVNLPLLPILLLYTLSCSLGRPDSYSLTDL